MVRRKSNAGRPKFGDEMKIKGFNLPIKLIAKIQREADKEQKAKKGYGNVSLWLRNVLERELEK